MSQRNPYTKEEDTHLVEFIATELPGLAGRQGNKPYQKLTENTKTYPWARGHSWQSWRDRYKTNKRYFDQRIAKYQELNGIVVDAVGGRSAQRKAFTADEDKLLIKFLAVYCPYKTGRCGNAAYIMLVENADGKWPWSARHPFQGWRSRYVDNQESFDLRIRAYQKKRNIDVNASPPKRPAKGSHSENLAKRRKVEYTYDSQEERRPSINRPSPSKNHSHPSPSKVAEVKVEAKPHAAISQIASTSKEEVVNEVRRDDGNGRDAGDGDEDEDDDEDGDDDDDDDDSEDDDDDDSEDLIPIGSEDYRGEIFQDGTVAESRGPVEEMPGIEEDVAGEEEVSVPGPSPALSDHPNESPEKGSGQAEPLPQIREQPEKDALVDGAPPSSFSPPKPAQPKHGKNDFALISQSRRLPNDDPFEDDPSSPHRTRNLAFQKAKRPPAITEGAFGNRFQTEAKKGSRESSPEESSDDQETSAVWATSPHPPRTKESKEVKVDPTWPPLRSRKSNTEGVNGTAMKTDLERQAAEQRRREKGKQKAVEPDQSMEAPTGEQHPPAPSPIKPPQLPSSKASKTTEAGSIRNSKAQRRATDFAGPPAPLPETMEMKSPKRHSTGNIRSPMMPSNSRKINLRQEIAHRQLLSQQQPQHSFSGTSHVSSSIISEDEIRDLKEFKSQCLKMWSEQFRYPVDTISDMWYELRNTGEMVELLKRAEEASNRALNELREGRSNVSSTFSRKGEDTSRSFETSLKVNKKANIDNVDLNASRSSPFTIVHHELNGSSTRRNSSVGIGGKRGRKSLEIRLVDPERASADAEAFYHPLTGTRAGNFDRLMKMGREDEALEREQRRVSSVALSPLRNMSQEEQLRTQGMPESEMLGMPEVEMLGSNDDDVYEEVDIPIEGEDGDEEDVDKMDIIPAVELEDEEMGEVSLDVEDRMVEMEPDISQPQSNGLKRRYHDVDNEQSELNDACPEINGRESVGQDIEFAPDIDSNKSRSAEVETMAVEKTEAERWEKVEDLFLAANRSNLETLKKIEKEFSAEFLSEWLTNKFTIELFCG